ncbi:hypothetical protein BKA62DRAFT_672568 [Auriculariales sp. MPI-PUGE-AT-0066]|nr:hypothetical protein BKA62DRAFT_672568 [Auriculariales sp. MPI-PUGE-AT-0066]
MAEDGTPKHRSARPYEFHSPGPGDPLTPIVHHHYAAGAHVVNNYGQPSTSPTTPVKDSDSIVDDGSWDDFDFGSDFTQRMRAQAAANRTPETPRTKSLATRPKEVRASGGLFGPPGQQSPSQFATDAHNLISRNLPFKDSPTPARTARPSLLAPVERSGRPYSICTPVWPSTVASPPAALLSRIRPPAYVPTLGAFTVDDMLSDPRKMIAAGHQLDINTIGLHPTSVHPCLIRDSDKRNDILSYSQSRGRSWGSITLIFQARGTTRPKTTLLDPKSDGIRVFTNATRTHSVNPEFTTCVVELMEQVFRHGLAADHVASFGARNHYADPIPVASRRTIFALPQPTTIPAQRMRYLERKHGAYPDLGLLIAAMREMTGLSGHEAQRIKAIVVNITPAFVPPELWLAEFRGVVPDLTLLQASHLVDHVFSHFTIAFLRTCFGPSRSDDHHTFPSYSHVLRLLIWSPCMGFVYPQALSAFRCRKFAQGRVPQPALSLSGAAFCVGSSLGMGSPHRASAITDVDVSVGSWRVCDDLDITDFDRPAPFPLLVPLSVVLFVVENSPKVVSRSLHCRSAVQRSAWARVWVWARRIARLLSQTSMSVWAHGGFATTWTSPTLTAPLPSRCSFPCRVPQPALSLSGAAFCVGSSLGMGSPHRASAITDVDVSVGSWRVCDDLDITDFDRPAPFPLLVPLRVPQPALSLSGAAFCVGSSLGMGSPHRASAITDVDALQSGNVQRDFKSSYMCIPCLPLLTPSSSSASSSTMVGQYFTPRNQIEQAFLRKVNQARCAEGYAWQYIISIARCSGRARWWPIRRRLREYLEVPPSQKDPEEWIEYLRMAWRRTSQADRLFRYDELLHRAFADLEIIIRERGNRIKLSFPALPFIPSSSSFMFRTVLPTRRIGQDHLVGNFARLVSSTSNTTIHNVHPERASIAPERRRCPNDREMLFWILVTSWWSKDGIDEVNRQVRENIQPAVALTPATVAAVSFVTGDARLNRSSNEAELIRLLDATAETPGSGLAEYLTITAQLRQAAMTKLDILAVSDAERPPGYSIPAYNAWEEQLSWLDGGCLSMELLDEKLDALVDVFIQPWVESRAACLHAHTVIRYGMESSSDTILVATQAILSQRSQHFHEFRGVPAPTDVPVSSRQPRVTTPFSSAWIHRYCSGRCRPFQVCDSRQPERKLANEDQNLIITAGWNDLSLQSNPPRPAISEETTLGVNPSEISIDPKQVSNGLLIDVCSTSHFRTTCGYIKYARSADRRVTIIGSAANAGQSVFATIGSCTSNARFSTFIDSLKHTLYLQAHVVQNVQALPHVKTFPVYDRNQNKNTIALGGSMNGSTSVGTPNRLVASGAGRTTAVAAMSVVSAPSNFQPSPHPLTGVTTLSTPVDLTPSIPQLIAAIDARKVAPSVAPDQHLPQRTLHLLELYSGGTPEYRAARCRYWADTIKNANPEDLTYALAPEYPGLATLAIQLRTPLAQFGRNIEGYTSPVHHEPRQPKVHWRFREAIEEFGNVFPPDFWWMQTEIVQYHELARSYMTHYTPLLDRWIKSALSVDRGVFEAQERRRLFDSLYLDACVGSAPSDTLLPPAIPNYSHVRGFSFMTTSHDHLLRNERLVLLANVLWAPTALPPTSRPVLRVDGTYGAGDWSLRGQLYRGSGSAIEGCSPSLASCDQRVWFDCDLSRVRPVANTRALEQLAVVHPDDACRMFDSLTSIKKDIKIWRTLHASYPHGYRSEIWTLINTLYDFLANVGVTRHLLPFVLAALRRQFAWMVGWINLRVFFERAMSYDRAGESQYLPTASYSGELTNGIFVTDKILFERAARLGIPTFYLTRVPLEWQPIGVELKPIAPLRLETRVPQHPPDLAQYTVLVDRPVEEMQRRLLDLEDDEDIRWRLDQDEPSGKHKAVAPTSRRQSLRAEEGGQASNRNAATKASTSSEDKFKIDITMADRSWTYPEWPEPAAVIDKVARLIETEVNGDKLYYSLKRRQDRARDPTHPVPMQDNIEPRWLAPPPSLLKGQGYTASKRQYRFVLMESYIGSLSRRVVAGVGGLSTIEWHNVLSGFSPDLKSGVFKPVWAAVPLNTLEAYESPEWIGDLASAIGVPYTPRSSLAPFVGGETSVEEEEQDDWFLQTGHISALGSPSPLSCQPNSVFSACILGPASSRRPEHQRYLHQPNLIEPEDVLFALQTKEFVISDSHLSFKEVESTVGLKYISSGADSWVSFDKRLVLVCPLQYLHPYGRFAEGEQVLARPVVVEGKIMIEYSHLRVWHGWQTSQKISVPLDALGRNGVRCPTATTSPQTAAAALIVSKPALSVRQTKVRVTNQFRLKIPPAGNPPSFANLVCDDGPDIVPVMSHGLLPRWSPPGWTRLESGIAKSSADVAAAASTSGSSVADLGATSLATAPVASTITSSATVSSRSFPADSDAVLAQSTPAIFTAVAPVTASTSTPVGTSVATIAQSNQVTAAIGSIAACTAPSTALPSRRTMSDGAATSTAISDTNTIGVAATTDTSAPQPSSSRPTRKGKGKGPSAHPPKPWDSYDWLSPDWRRFVCFRAIMMFFYCAVFTLDVRLRSLYPDNNDLNDESTIDRMNVIFAFWGGTTPLGEVHRGCFFSKDLHERRLRLAALHRIVKVWPKVQLPETVPTAPEDLARYEEKLWLAYAQTYIDYFRRYPVFPTPIPTLPPGVR